jgi:hypothetical protein
MPKNSDFLEQLENSGFSFKPSFFLMSVSQLAETQVSTAKLTHDMAESAAEVNKDIRASKDEPPDTAFEITSIEQIDENVLEIRLRWEAPVHYWNPRSVQQESVKTLKVGFVLFHRRARKALVSCHTESERSHITQIVARALNIHFAPIVLTKKLLDQIGTFDTVRRASYFFQEKRPDRARSITFADDLLGSIPDVRAHEDNAYAERKLSFYRIPLVGLGERGVGATSDSAKLWIPSEAPVTTVREFGIALLEKVTGTIKKMRLEGDLDGLLRVVISDANPLLASVKSVNLRRDIQDLTTNLIRMLLAEESERAFHPCSSFLTSGVPTYFDYGRLAFTDDSGSTTFWRYSDGSELLKFKTTAGGWTVSGYPSQVPLDLNSLVHPTLDTTVSVADPPSAAYLFPTKKLHDLILGLVQSLVGDIPKLKKVVALPFYFGAGVLRLDLKRAQSSKLGALVGRVIAPEETKQLSTVSARQLSHSKRQDLIEVLNKLGEKCEHMSDSNCRACLSDRQFLCLRSLLARFMRNHLLLSHKNIELCDLQGKFDAVEGEQLATFVFSKLSHTRAGLTLRNNNGAILFSQIVAHVDKTTFNTVGVLSSSTINEDLRERLTFLGGLTGKTVVFFDGPILSRMLAEFEDQSTFEGVDPKLVYKISKSKNGTLPDNKRTAGSLIPPNAG